ncbi:MAG: SDR family NAD(P)-dependent oxidoreductase, partial [Microcystaceae cyanobacterium]
SCVRHPKDNLSDLEFLLTTVGKLWLTGGTINWENFYQEQQRCRLPLPTYPFERQRYWLDSGNSASDLGLSTHSLDKKLKVEDWFYIPSWKRSALKKISLAETSTFDSSCWLIFIDQLGFGEKLAKKLELQGYNLIKVKESAEFVQFNSWEYGINPNNPNDYDMLVKNLQSNQLNPSQIVHCWTVTNEKAVALDEQSLDNMETLSFDSLLFLCQALGKQKISQKVQLTVVSNHLQDVTGQETLCPLKALSLGMIKVITQEFPNISSRSVDLSLDNSQSHTSEKYLEQLVQELHHVDTDSVVAYRGSYRWIQSFEPYPLEKKDDVEIQLRDQGVYLITGGLGGIGLTIAKYLAQTVKARLILTCRSSFPERTTWDDWLASNEENNEIAKKITKVKELEDLGAKVLVCSANVANLPEMQGVIDQSLSQFGELHGVIHAAGVPGGGLIQNKTLTEVQKVFSPKVQGTLVLDQVLDNIPLDFWVLCSSLTSILGGLGQVDYCAANNFLDAFAFYKRNRSHAPVISINWDTWQQLGMATHSFERFKPNKATKEVDIESATKMNHPLLDYCVVDSADQKIYQTQLRVADYWILKDHKILNQATVPGTAYLEMAIAALGQSANQKTIEIHNLYFLAPLILKEEQTAEVQTILTRKGSQDNEWNFLIKSRVSTPNSPWKDHAKGEIVGLPSETSTQIDLNQFDAQCQELEVMNPLSQENLGRFHLTHFEESVLIEETGDAESVFIELGPRWNCLKSVKIGENQGLACLELAEAYKKDTNDYQLHPALLDFATGFIRLFKNQFSYLPLSYKRMSLKRPLTDQIYVYVTYQKNPALSQATLKFNLTLTDAQGMLLAEIEDFTLKKLSASQLTPNSNAEQSARIVSKPREDRNLNVVTTLAQNKLLKNALLPSEGIDVWERILSNPMGQFVISTVDLSSKLQNIHSLGVNSILDSLKPQTGSDEPQKHYPRPDLSNPYVAPNNETEKTLANIWQNLLGIIEVGIHDNFFELGGDSLLATQIISEVREAFQVELPVGNLFEEPTIESLAQFIESLLWASDATHISASAETENSLVREEGEI